MSYPLGILFPPMIILRNHTLMNHFLLQMTCIKNDVNCQQRSPHQLSLTEIRQMMVFTPKQVNNDLEIYATFIRRKIYNK